jgi:hypothetical protein
MHRIALAALAALLLAPSAGAQEGGVAPPLEPPADTAAAVPVRDFLHDLADPVEAGVAVAMGMYDHLRTHPKAWGGGADALAQRIVSRAGGHVVGTSVRHGVAAALGRSTRYEPCRCTTSVERIEHALLETFTDRDRTGRRVFSEPYLAGTLAGSIAPALWHPDVSLRDGVVASGVSLLFTVAARIALELVPVP